jgi:Dolichyl-phosphate-mannose-protein mannosyltransferase
MEMKRSAIDVAEPYKTERNATLLGHQDRPEHLERLWATLSIILLVLCSLSYFFSTFAISSQAPLWMDEVMAKWMSQLHPNKMIWTALLHGTMSSPPTYFFLLKIVQAMLGGSNLALRIPSIIAVYVTACCAYLLMRRRFPNYIAALAMVLCLETGLFTFATQVREYALVTACFALAVLIWDTQFGEEQVRWRAPLVLVCLAACVALHFYGVVVVAAFALMEIFWSIANRRARTDLWSAIILAGGSVLVWLPLIRHITKFTGSEAASPNYFGKPTISRLLSAYADLAVGGKGLTLLCSMLLIVAFVLFWERISPSSRRSSPGVDAYQGTQDTNWNVIILATTSIPILVFLFALVVTGTFNERYAVAASFGFAMLFAGFLGSSRMGAVMSCMLLLASSFLIAAAPRRLPPADHYGSAAMTATKDTEPIVVGEGLAFLELQAAADPRLKSRLVYLTTPEGEFNADPTNEDLVRRWQEFRPDLRVVDPQSFLKTNSRFFVLHTDQSMDVITPWLMHTALLRAVWNNVSEKDKQNVWLFEASR